MNTCNYLRKYKQNIILMQTHVYEPAIADMAAKSMADFCKRFNSQSHESSVRVLGYLHGGRGCKMRIEPVEKCGSRDLTRWNKMAAASQCRILNIQVNAAEGCVDICTEYNPSSSLFKGTRWQNLLLPALLLILVLKYTGMLQIATGFQI